MAEMYMSLIVKGWNGVEEAAVDKDDKVRNVGGATGGIRVDFVWGFAALISVAAHKRLATTYATDHNTLAPTK